MIVGNPNLQYMKQFFPIRYMDQITPLRTFQLQKCNNSNNKKTFQIPNSAKSLIILLYWHNKLLHIKSSHDCQKGWRISIIFTKSALINKNQKIPKETKSSWESYNNYKSHIQTRSQAYKYKFNQWRKRRNKFHL